MNSTARIVVLPALAAALVLGGSACAAPGAGPQAAGPAGTPSPADASATAAARPGTEALVVAAAQPGAEQSAVSTPGTAGRPTASPAARNVRLASYDPSTGTAVLTAGTTGGAAGGSGGAGTAPSASPAARTPGASAAKPSAKPSVAASATASATSSAAASSGPSAAADTVRAGQLIASPPTAAAPQGALLAVTAVQPGKDGSVTAATRPATLAELLGSSEADGKVAVDPHAITVKPLVKDLKLSFGQDAGTTKADASGTLQLDLKAPVALPGGSAEASGSLQLHPAVHFAYHGAAQGSPRTASVGFDLGAHAQWRVSGELAKSTGAPIRVPFAELHANPVLTVGGLPVVVNLGLTCFLEVSADGKVSVDAEQQFDGAWTVQAQYTGGHGWSPVTDTGDTKVSPIRAQLSGKASVRAGLGAEVNVGLYNAVGVDVTLEPYLRAQGEGSVVVDTSKSGGKPQLNGSLALYGGVDLTGALLAHLKIFGTPVVEGRIPLPVFHREWLLKSVSSGAAPGSASSAG
ncbi:hypothetical protein ACFC1R_25785 [Kitasatospora sp. NPDC056138]|uniref:hypothetical protein n=1 Tax=Kitasatospora sp. NPDC056138 TaxID=3345724 RepID=UPI0035D571FF